MNCKKCGIPIGPQQGICPGCGTPVIDTNDFNNMQSVPNTNNLVNMQGVNTNQSMPIYNLVNMTMPNQNNEHVIPNQNMGISNNFDNNSMGNVLEPSNFNLASDNKVIQQSNMNTQNMIPSMLASNLVNPPSNMNMGFNQNTNNMNKTNNEQNGMYIGDLKLPDEDGSKKKFPWFIVAGILVVVMVVGILFVPQLNKLNVSTYVGDYYDLEYNANWSVDEDEEEMTLYYSDNNSKFMFNALSSFKALNSSVDSEASKKDLYSQFYNAWSNLDGGELTGGTETFLRLNEDTLYARVDYAVTGETNVGSFYVIVSEKNDKVISFMTYCSTDNKEKIDKEVLKMLDSLNYKKDSERSIYNKFKAGETKNYMALGYMKYDVPECWTLDEYRTKDVKDGSNVFKFIDEFSLLNIKAATPWNSATGTVGTTYEIMKNSIVKEYGAVKSEKTKTFNGKVWYIIVTPDYEAGDLSFHNEIYFTLSTTNKHLYYIQAYVYNETSEKKTKYLRDSIEYIITSAKLEKVTE